MRDAGFGRDQAAARLGHADSELLETVYDQGDRRARMRKAIDHLAGEGLRAAVHQEKEEAAALSSDSAATPSGRLPG